MIIIAIPEGRSNGVRIVCDGTAERVVGDRIEAQTDVSVTNFCEPCGWKVK